MGNCEDTAASVPDASPPAPRRIDRGDTSSPTIGRQTESAQNLSNARAVKFRDYILEAQLAWMSRRLQEYAKNKFIDESMKELVRARLIGVGSAVVEEMCSRVQVNDRDAFYDDLKKAGNEHVLLKLADVGHHVEENIQYNAFEILRDVLCHGREATSKSGKPAFYDQVVQAAPLLEKIISPNGVAQYAYVEHISTKDFFRQRLKGVGEDFITEVSRNFDTERWREPVGTAKKFYDDLYAAERGDEKKIATIHKSLDIRVAAHVGAVIQFLHDHAVRSGTVVGGNPRLYEQMIESAPVLDKIMRKHNDTVGADLLQALVDRGYANGRLGTVGPSRTPAEERNTGSGKRKRTHSPDDRNRHRPIR